MPNTSSAKKKLRSDARKTRVNRKIREQVTTVFKEFTQSPSASSLSKVYSTLDKASKKNVISKQRVGRKKSQASKLIRSSSRTKKIDQTTKAAKHKRKNSLVLA